MYNCVRLQSSRSGVTFSYIPEASIDESELPPLVLMGIHRTFIFHCLETRRSLDKYQDVQWPGLG